MKLTSYQEEQLIQQYDRLLWSVVHRFKRRNHGGYDNKEDLHSECTLVFLRHIRSCETMEEVRKVPIRDMINAMCRFVLEEQALTYPQRTTNFSHVIKNAAHKTDYTAVDRDEDRRSDPMNDTLDEIAFSNFYHGLSAEDRIIVKMKLDGKRNCDVAHDLGVTDVIITRALKRLRRIYTVQAA